MSSEDDPRRLLSPKQVATQTGFSERKVYRLMKGEIRGLPTLPSFKIGQDRRVKQADIDEFLERLRES